MSEDQHDVSDRRVLVVGASTGIGRSTVVALARAGARVVASARRGHLLDDVVAEAGEHARAVPADVRDAGSVEHLVATAVGHLGGLDALVYATGVNHLAFLEDTEPEDWQRVLETNLVGAALVTRAALGALRAEGGRVAFLSSHSVPDPWPALGAYAASKAALDTMIAAWRPEVPEVTFTRLVVGPTITGMAEAWDAELSARMFDRWAAEGRFEGIVPVEPEVVAEVVRRWLADPHPPEDIDMLAGHGGPASPSA